MRHHRLTRSVAALTLVAALGGLTGCKAPPPPTPGTIDILGDSITFQAAWGRLPAFDAQGRPAGSDRLVQSFPGAFVEDLQSAEAARVNGSPARPETLVIALGTNNALPASGGWTSADTSAYRRLLNLPSTTACVVVVLPGFATKAAVTTEMLDQVGRARTALRALVAERRATAPTVIADWAALVRADPTLTDADGIHLPTTGGAAFTRAADRFAQLMWDGVAACP